ncbi:MAG TPA: amino acid adenylation domain-containing protein, partial [Ktedonobacteraceae bacterium]
TSARWQELARQQQVTFNTLLQGAWAYVLSRYSGQTDVVFGQVVSGRSAPLLGIERLIGLFINTLPVRVQVRNGEQIGVWLHHLQAQQLEQQHYEHTSLVQVRAWSQVPPAHSLFESLLVFENYPVEAALHRQPEHIQVQAMQAREQTNYPLNIIVVPMDGLTIQISYDRQRFLPATIQRLLQHLQTVLQQLVTRPEARLADIVFLTPAERKQLLEEWIPAPVALPQPPCLAQHFAQQVERTPDAVAVICEQQQITYRALDRRANQLAHYLRRQGVGPDQFVGVALERSLELVVALLGILKAGGAYLPLDPDYPSDRLAYMLEDARPVLLLTQHSLQARLPETNMPMLSLDQLWETLRAEPESALAIPIHPEHLAYVIYTSGSTGRPKGTMITQQGVCNSLQWMQATYPLAARDCVLQKTSLSFDPSVWELFWPLLVGARLTLARPGGHADHGYLLGLLAQEEVTTLNFAPAELRLFVEEPGWEQAVSVRRVMCGGEALPSELLQRFSVQKYAQLSNLYGPTEATIEVSFWICEAQNGGEGIVPIERPGANGQSYMLDVNATDKPFLSTYSLSQLFEQQVKRTPDAVALIFEQQQMTYCVLDRRANQLAHSLRRLGVGPDQFVGVALERSLELVVVLLGILKAGGAYLPLDPNHPSERLAYMLEDAQPALLLTQRSLQAQLPSTNIPLFCLDQLWEMLSAEPESTPAILLQPEHLAYVIYTSGSTGRPKGVMGTHRASLNRFHWMWQRYPFGPAEVCCQKTNLSFVDAVWEIFGPLLQGVTLVIMADDVVKDPAHLRRLLERQAVTRIVLVPSLLRVLLEDEQALQRQLHRLTYWVSSGEPLALEVAQRFRRCLPEARLLNLYGSSEVTADVTYYEVTDLDMLFSVPIGRPIANTQLYVLDTQHDLVPVGVTGELYIGGVGLARGYHRRPELTAERFIPHPFSQMPGQRLYRTGDLVRYRADGVLEFQGRIDAQVKLRGFRIELGEVEAVLRVHPEVRDVVVLLREETEGRSYLVAYVIAQAEGEGVTVAQLQAHMRMFVPEHMVPAFMILLDAFPLTPHGKVDRRALPLPDRQHNDLESYCAPQTP